jgi:hypothetical protein
LRLTHFFEGKLGREEVASAFLAMALESVPRFREHFFRLVTPNEYVTLSGRLWSVKVEKRQIDVHLETDDTIVLIENKVAAASKQTDQLLRYYLQERKLNQKARFIIVYLAPRQVGKNEITQVANSSEFKTHPDDIVQHLSWDNLAEYVPRRGDIYDEIIRKWLDEVQHVILEKSSGKYSIEGDRDLLRKFVNKALKKLTNETGLNIKPWSGESETIYTAGTNITIYIAILLDLEKEPPFRIQNTRDESGSLVVTIQSKFKLGGKIKKSSEIAKWWAKQIEPKFFEIAGVGKHVLQEDRLDGILVHNQVVSGEEVIEKTFIDTGLAVIRELSQKLLSAGFKLSQSGAFHAPLGGA